MRHRQSHKKCNLPEYEPQAPPLGSFFHMFILLGSPGDSCKPPAGRPTERHRIWGPASLAPYKKCKKAKQSICTYIYTLMLLKNGIEINTYTDEDIDTCENTEVWVLEVGDMGPGGALHRSVPKGPVCGILGLLSESN